MEEAWKLDETPGATEPPMVVEELSELPVPIDALEVEFNCEVGQVEDSEDAALLVTFEDESVALVGLPEELELPDNAVIEDDEGLPESVGPMSQVELLTTVYEVRDVAELVMPLTALVEDKEPP